MSNNLIDALQTLTVEEARELRIRIKEERCRRLEILEKTREKLNGLTRPPVPPAYDFLWTAKMPDTGIPVRYKVCKGGRGKGATWSIARRLIDKAHTQNSLILCTREVQKSIKDSVHRVLKNQIKKLGYSEFFHITNSSIRSLISDSEFLFHGLNDLSVDDIKSMEGITDVWVAEGEKTTKNSWLTLDPTIREGGSEIYVDYNPKEEYGATNRMFTTDCPDNALVRHINYDENPYFPEVLEKLRLQALAKIDNAPTEDAREQLMLDYKHVWLGHTIRVSKASILGAKFRVEDFDPLHPENGDRYDGPYDGADWGFSQDPTTRIRVWVKTTITGRKKLCIERELYGKGIELRDLAEFFDGKKQGHLAEWPNSRIVRVRADNARPETVSYMKQGGFNIVSVEKWPGSVEEGLEHIRGEYDEIIVHTRCKYTAEEMLLYSFKIDRLTGEVTTDIVDEFNHCIDAIRYALAPMIKRRKGFFNV